MAELSEAVLGIVSGRAGTLSAMALLGAARVRGAFGLPFSMSSSAFERKEGRENEAAENRAARIDLLEVMLGSGR